MSKVALVYIDTKALVYKRYEGNKRTHAFQALEPVEAQWIEVLRTKPEEFLNEPVSRVSEDPTTKS